MTQQSDNQALSFERVLFFSDAVFAIVITLLVLELRVPHIQHDQLNESSIRHSLLELIPKFLGFIYSFFIVGLMWVEHHRIFRYIGSYDMGLIWRNLVFLLFVAFIPFPTALFSEYFQSQTAFILYVAGFGMAAIAKIWIWNHAVSRRSELINSDVDDELIKRVSRRSWAVPIVCAVAIAMSFIGIGLGGLCFPFIPIVAHLLYPNKKLVPAVEVQ